MSCPCSSGPTLGRNPTGNGCTRTSWRSSKTRRVKCTSWGRSFARPCKQFPGSVPAYQLIDGQQRLTTLTVVLAGIRDVARVRGIGDLAEEITEDYLVHKRKQDTERFKVLPRVGDREALSAIIEGKETAPFSPCVWSTLGGSSGTRSYTDPEKTRRQFSATSSRQSGGGFPWW